MEIKQENGVFAYLKQYQSFQSVEDMDKAVGDHIYHNQYRLTESEKSVLLCLAAYSLKFIGACHIKAKTVADKAGISNKTFYRSINRLEHLKIIERINSTKLNGIKGANIYRILPFLQNECPNEMSQQKMSERETKQNTHSGKVSSAKNENQSFNSFNHSSNLEKNSLNTYTQASSFANPTLYENLKSIYMPITKEECEQFRELMNVAFGSIKKFKQTTGLPHAQLEEIVLRSLKVLLTKKNVNNPCAMFSGIIKNQVLNITQPFVKPNRRTEHIPDWFYKQDQPEQSKSAEIDFEAERQKMLAKLNV